MPKQLKRQPGKQSLPKFLQLLNENELDLLTKYEHDSPKTAFEHYHSEHISGAVEKYLIPESLSPNVITIIG